MRKNKKEGIVLKEGEATGHAHKIFAKVKFDKDNKKLKTKEAAPIEHEEHDTIVLPAKKGLRVDDVVEYDPIEEEIRNIAD